MIKYEKFRLSLKRLEERYQNYVNPNLTFPDYMCNAVAESTIQRFEVCWECFSYGGNCSRLSY